MAKKPGSLYQRCDTRRGCPELVTGPDGRTKTRPKHKCKGPWVAALDLPAVTGERKRRVVVRARKEDAQTELAKLRQTLAANPRMGTSSPTLAAWSDTWIQDVAKRRVRPNTIKFYRKDIRLYIKPAIGRTRLDRIGPEHVDRLRKYVLNDLQLSPSTALGAHRTLSVILRDAMRRRLITENACTLTDAPRKPKKVAREGEQYLGVAEARRLLAALDPGDGTVPLELALFSVALLSGRRQGERLGLLRDDLDFDRGIMRVSWQLQQLTYEHGCGTGPILGTRWPCGRLRGGNCPQRQLHVPDDYEVDQVYGGQYLVRPKAEASGVEIPMIGPLAAVLEQYAATHDPGMKGLLFARPDGKPITAPMDTDAWKAALDLAGLPRVKGHSARDTCNTILVELKIPIDVRQKILGHGSEAANRIYSHTSDVRVRDALAELGAAVDWREQQL